MANIPPVTINLGATGKKGKKKPKTPAQKAADAAATKAAKQKLAATQYNPYDPWVTIGKNGNVVPVKDSSKALHVGGQPLTKSAALSLVSRYNDLFLSYLGRPITPKEFQHLVIDLGWSTYQIKTKYLMNRPNFATNKSPLWRQQSGDYIAVWHSIYGENSTPDNAAVKYAVVNNLSTGTFADMLQKRPDYVNSNKYKTEYAGLADAYTSIYGIPDAKGDAIIKKATLGGQTAEELKAWLRKQPEYPHSSEFQSKALGLANALMGVSGTLPTLGPGPPLTGQPGTKPSQPGMTVQTQPPPNPIPTP